MTKKELFDMIQKNISGFIPNIVFEDVSECIDKQGMEVELIAEVFKDTIYKQVKMPLNYFRKTLIRLAVENIKTVDDYQKQKEEHQQARNLETSQKGTDWKNPKSYNSYSKLPNKIPADQVPPLPPNVKRF